VELFSGGARAKLPVQMSFADASPAAAAQYAQAAAASAAAAPAAPAASPSPSPPPRAQRNSSLKRKASSRSSVPDAPAAASAAAASSSSPPAAAPPVFDPALLSRLLERDRDAPPDVLPATPFDSGFELVRAAERSVMDLLADRDIPTAADIQPLSSPA